MTIKLSPSTLSAFRQCQRRYFWQSRNYVPILQKVAITFGTEGHKVWHALHTVGYAAALQELEKIQAWYSSLWQEEQEHYGPMHEGLGLLLDSYIGFYGMPDVSQVVMAETRLEYLLPGGVLLNGKPDIIRKERGTHHIDDHKFTRELPNGAGEKLSDVATSIYAFLIESNGIGEVKAITWNYIKSKAPSKPSVLKDGKRISKAKCDTTPKIFLQTIEEHGFNPADYSDVLEALSYNDFFQRITLPYDREMTTELLREVLITAEDIKTAENRGKFTHNFSWTCKSCQYFPLCECEIHRGDIQGMLKANFKQEERT